MTDVFELIRHSLIGGDDLVESIGDLSREPGLVTGESDREISQPNCLERVQQEMLIQRAVEVPVAISL
jgi:hypothetical protein